MDVYMEEALKEAEKAFLCGDVPVGCVVVKNGEIIGRGYNKRELNNIVILHAEVVAIMQANETLKNWRLNDCDIYVTKEPCDMCYEIIKQSRINKIYCGIKNDKKYENSINKLKVVYGIKEKECKEIFVNFFTKLRLK